MFTTITRAVCSAVLIGSVGFAVSAHAQVGGNAPAGATNTGNSRFSGSMVSFRPMVSALSLDRSAEPTYNPYIGSQVLIAPRFRIDKRFNVSGLLIVNREFTHSSSTTYAGETTLSDTFVTANARLLSHKATGLGLGANLQIRLPTSKGSLGRSFVVGTLAGLTGSWSKGFSVAGVKQRLTLVAIGRVGRFFHRYGEASLETPWLSECGALPTGCARFSHSGARNVAWRTQAIGVVNYSPVPKLNVSAQIGSFYDLLDPLPDAHTQGFTIAADPTDPNARGIAFYILSVSYQPTAAFAIAAGTETANAHLAPDSTYRAAFFNRNTTFFLSLRAFPAALL